MIRIVKNTAISVAAISLSIFGLSGLSSGIAATTVGGTSSFDTTNTASADTLAACSWYVSGVDPSVTLSNASGMEYVGNDYELSGENSQAVSIFFSGSSSPDDRCSFYDDEKGVNVAVSWDGTEFTASGSDHSLDFKAGDLLEDPASNGGDPSTFNITYTKEGCNDDWTAGSSVKISDGSTPPLHPASIADASVASHYEPTLKSGATFASCDLGASYSAWLPGGRTPTNPGSSYAFTGPTLTTQVTINS